jgi:hypothetical protein
MARFEDAIKLLMATFLLSKITADELGEEKALETLGKWAHGMYYKTFEDKKKQLGVTGRTLKDIYLWLREGGQDLGAVYEIEEETPDKISMRIKSCPVGPACEATGWDCENLCMKIVKPLVKDIPALVNPNVEWNIVKWSPNIMEGCQYELVYKK